MNLSLDQAFLYTHFMYGDCWHELPQTLLGLFVLVEKKHIFHISG